MNPWKTATFILAVLLSASVAMNWQARNSATNASANAATIAAEFATLRIAVNDTQSYLNWYHVTQDDGLTKEDFESNLVILRNRYLHHFPDWAEITMQQTSRMPR